MKLGPGMNQGQGFICLRLKGYGRGRARGGEEEQK